jgi:hypothetical protein
MDANKKEDLHARAAKAGALQAKNGHFVYPGYPVSARELLNDPRLDGLVERWKGHPTTQVLEPTVITREPSKYLQMKHDFSVQPIQNAMWINKPGRSSSLFGEGSGFEGIVTERPRFEQPKPSPKKLFHFWQYGSLFVASPDVREVLLAACPRAIASIPIDWIFSDGQALEGYELIDIVAVHDAYDYSRSVVSVELRDGFMVPRLGLERAMSHDIPSDACLFRDSLYRNEVFVSRDLAAELARFADREASFYDVHTRQPVAMPRIPPSQALKARLKKDQWTIDDDALPLDRRLRIRIMPLTHSGRFAEAEELLTRWLLELPPTSFHVIADLRITTPLERCAEFFDQFVVQARSEYDLKALYSEMNGFGINPDLWFCDAFGFSFDGGDDLHDWLGDFASSSQDPLIISGLEPAQEAFASWMASDARTPKSLAKALAEALVIAKFQGWLQRSLAQMKPLSCPFWAAAHDYYNYLGKIAPVDSRQ